MPSLGGGTLWRTERGCELFVLASLLLFAACAPPDVVQPRSVPAASTVASVDWCHSGNT
jgi:hypothetical protein